MPNWLLAWPRPNNAVWDRLDSDFSCSPKPLERSKKNILFFKILKWIELPFCSTFFETKSLIYVFKRHLNCDWTYPYLFEYFKSHLLTIFGLKITWSVEMLRRRKLTLHEWPKEVFFSPKFSKTCFFYQSFH